MKKGRGDDEVSMKRNIDKERKIKMRRGREDGRKEKGNQKQKVKYGWKGNYEKISRTDEIYRKKETHTHLKGGKKVEYKSEVSESDRHRNMRE